MAETINTGPSYYKRGSIETWDFIRASDLNFHLGNAIKYIVRAGYKDSKVEDLKKAIHYLENELQHTDSTRTSKRIPLEFRSWENEHPQRQRQAEEFDR